MTLSSYLITNYKGKYSLQAEVDRNTGDFCRNENGQLENYLDIWIDCECNGKIFHYGGRVLEFYCPSLGRGHNIVKSIYEKQIGSLDKFETITISDKGNECKTFDYGAMYTELSSNGIVYDIQDTDEEVLFKFKAANIELLKPYLKPRTFCADRSPFSAKNIHKYNRKNGVQKYTIPMEELASYKEITALIGKDNISLYTKINSGYLSELYSKKPKDKDRLIAETKKKIKLSGMKFYEWVHSTGYENWNSYLSYMKNTITQGEFE